MKLTSKTLLYYLAICLPLMAVAGFVSFKLLRHELLEGVDDSLAKENANAVHLIQKENTGTIYLSADSLSFIKPVATAFEEQYYDSTIYDAAEKEQQPYRFYKNHVEKNGDHYVITTAKPTFEQHELLENLWSTFLLIAAFLILAFFIVNWLIAKVLWKPFYSTIELLNLYDLKEASDLRFGNSRTKEFNRLNDALNKMTKKIHHDYLQQKEFTENAAHEMQTPLAVIKANLSLLMQSPNMKAEEMNQLQAIDNTTKKLASLNKALLLLSKIDNHQFRENALVNMEDVFKKVLAHFDDLLLAKHIQVECHIAGQVGINMNPALAEILATNLVQNAIRHNVTGGKIHFKLFDKTLTLSNTGEPLHIKQTDLFRRFKKNDASKESLGLGLAIVKSICNLYHIKINYSHNHSLHNFTLDF